ncbi:ribosome assembly RNA-binding protein YhbY [Anaeromyxobacter sp. SG17]|uniref:ribosome assembly RNA-binding protein YhbY n=1 Tax=Anaeromyxobacter sp. SG17 TaxID=2925405 RepID=UPI001F562EA0|nr:ribosome assembly RNA-binding protein YhbY [Anaeromyxobacter sp. SG17]
MPAPTNPKKRALMASTRLRKTLRAAGHHLSPVVQVGKEGVTEAVLRQLDDALGTHELVKVKIGTETPEDRFEAADRLGAETGAQVAQILGRTILVYRRHPEKPRYEAAPARPAAEAPERPTRARATKRTSARKSTAARAKPTRGANRSGPRTRTR